MSQSSTQQNTPSLNSTASYESLAETLPHPEEITTIEEGTTELPRIAEELQIPRNEINPESLPYNTDSTSWRSWRSKFSTITALYPLAAQHHEEYLQDRRTVHAVISPKPSSIQSLTDITEWRQKATTIAKQNGIRGGVSAFHGFRVKSDVQELFNSLIEGKEVEATATSVLLWEWLRRDTNMKQYLEWGPHFHVIGLCSEDEDSLSKKQFGAVVKRLRTFDSYTRDMPMTTISSHRSVSKDIIDHLTFNPSENNAPLRWFGTLKGQSHRSAKQYVTDTTLDKIRDKLINGRLTQQEQITVSQTQNKQRNQV